MRPGIDPKVDFAFKRVFGCEHTKPLLLHLLNAILQYPAEQRLASLELLNPFNDKLHFPKEAKPTPPVGAGGAGGDGISA